MTRIGETLPPVATQLLQHLDVMQPFTAQRHHATYGTAAAWGAPSLADNDFIYSARGSGWHLDRAAFDAMLLCEAHQRGASIVCDVRTRAVARVPEGWRVSLSNSASLIGRVVVDATGASASIARRLGAQHIVTDRLAGFNCFYEEDTTSEPRTLVEAFEDGWWYSAALPGKRRVVACMTDGDIARRLTLSDRSQWTRKLEQTRHIGRTVREARPKGEILVRAARSRILDTASGANWIAVGDAASSVDPLSSQGICRALRSGIFGSYAIADLLVRQRPDALARYNEFVCAEFTQYLRTRRKYYALENRWSSSDFWARRHCVT